MAKYYIGFGVLTAVVLALIVYGFTVIGTPSQRQASIFDSTRISNFRSISYEVDYYYQKNNQLPTTLSDVPSISYYNKDPQTTTGYDYMKVGDTSFKLCANFSEDSSKEKKDTDNYLYYDTEVPSPSKTTSSVSLTQYDSGYSTPSSSTHKKGYDCITYNVPSSYMKVTQPPPVFYVPNNSSYSYSNDASGRDAQRLAAVRQVMTGLELYYNDNGGYPEAYNSAPSVTGGDPKFSYYIPTYPVSPSPGCATNSYAYSSSGGSLNKRETYSLVFCLEGASGGFSAGTHKASPSGLK